MTYLPANSLTSYLPTDIILPEDPEQLRRILNDLIRKMVDATNDKDIGHYNSVQNINGQKFFDPNNPMKFHNVYRKVVDFGALPDTATKSVAHGITTTANTIFTRIYGTATNQGGAALTSAIPIPLGVPGVTTGDISIDVDATNVNITTGANQSGYTICYIVLEWLEAI